MGSDNIWKGLLVRSIDVEAFSSMESAQLKFRLSIIVCFFSFSIFESDCVFLSSDLTCFLRD